jgi:hypothetical protein
MRAQRAETTNTTQVLPTQVLPKEGSVTTQRRKCYFYPNTSKSRGRRQPLAVSQLEAARPASSPGARMHSQDSVARGGRLLRGRLRPLDPSHPDSEWRMLMCAYFAALRPGLLVGQASTHSRSTRQVRSSRTGHPNPWSTRRARRAPSAPHTH